MKSKQLFLFALPAVLIFTAGVAMLTSTSVQADGNGGCGATRQASYPSLIPNGNTFSCNTCHSDGNFNNPPTSTQFRVDFWNASRTWDAPLAAIDSDGDGFSNGEELQDPNGQWRPGRTPPGDPNLVTNPSDPSSFPAVTPTPQPTDTPIPQPTATPTTAATPTPLPSPGAYLQANGDRFGGGDTLIVDLTLINNDRTSTPALTFVAMELFGVFYFHPGYTEVAEVARTDAPLLASDVIGPIELLNIPFQSDIGIDVPLTFYSVLIDDFGDAVGGINSVSLTLE